MEETKSPNTVKVLKIGKNKFIECEKNPLFKVNTKRTYLFINGVKLLHSFNDKPSITIHYYDRNLKSYFWHHKGKYLRKNNLPTNITQIGNDILSECYFDTEGLRHRDYGSAVTFYRIIEGDQDHRTYIASVEYYIHGINRRDDISQPSKIRYDYYNNLSVICNISSYTDENGKVYKIVDGTNVIEIEKGSYVILTPETFIKNVKEINFKDILFIFIIIILLISKFI